MVGAAATRAWAVPSGLARPAASAATAAGSRSWRTYSGRSPPGAGKPIADLDRPYDELWWLRRKLRDEQFSIEPPVLELRRQFDEARARIAAAGTEAEVRRLVAAINERIVYVNSHTTSGPA